MTNEHKQQAHRDKAKAKLSVIKAKLRPLSKAQAEADRRAERLRQLLVVHPMLSAHFDAWIDSRMEQLRRSPRER
jgi:hypothetical protein